MTLTSAFKRKGDDTKMGRKANRRADKFLERRRRYATLVGHELGCGSAMRGAEDADEGGKSDGQGSVSE